MKDDFRFLADQIAGHINYIPDAARRVVLQLHGLLVVIPAEFHLVRIVSPRAEHQRAGLLVKREIFHV